MKIGLFGGTFDPIHLGHLVAAQQVLDKKLCDKIWFLPCYQNPLKEKSTETKHRKKMIELAIEKEKEFELNTTELKEKKTNYTIETIRKLKKNFPENEFCFIIASKALKEFNKWKKYDELAAEIRFIVVSFQHSDKIPKKIQKFNPIKLNPTLSSKISSTLIRKRLKEGKDVSVFLPKKVFDYIKENKLYGFK